MGSTLQPGLRQGAKSEVGDRAFQVEGGDGAAPTCARHHRVVAELASTGKRPAGKAAQAERP